MSVRNGLLLAALLAASGCTRLGPDFQPLESDWLAAWNSPTIVQASRPGSEQDLSHWWRVFADPQLERLIHEADAHNSDLRIAGLRVLEARAQLGIAQAGRYPQLQQGSADAFYLDQQQYDGKPARDSSLWQYSAGFDIGWELDFWGRFSRAIESADASFFAAQAQHADVLLLLRAQVASSYFSLRTAEARLRIAEENARRQKRSYQITERLFQSGNNAELDLQQAKTQYLGTLASIPQLQDQVHRSRNALAILLGRGPQQMAELDGNSGLIPLPEQALLDELPARLLLRRPDVRAAHWQVAAQSARIGIAESDLYPAISLLGTLGWSATSLDGSAQTLTTGGGPSLRWNLFDHGRIENNIRVQDARLQQLIEIYQASVRQAAREADDAASGLLRALERERILREAAHSAKRSLTLANAQYREGYSDFQRVLDAQRALFVQQDSYLLSRSDAVLNLIALYKALGGGWQQPPELLDAATREQMQQRTDWGALLDTPPAPGSAPDSSEDPAP